MKYEGAESWRNNLLVTSSGAIKPLLSNAITAFRDASQWALALCYDEFAGETIIDGPPPWYCEPYDWIPRPWSPADDVLAADWLQKQGIGVNVATTAQAIEAVARDRSFHPVQQFLDSLEHDGTARLNTWLSTYLGAEQSPYTATVGRAMLIGAVARIQQPGCKVDTVPILEGKQGARKSTAVKTIFGEQWFSDELADLGSKDAAMQTRGVWGIEVSELDAMSRMEVSRIKAFITRTTDRYRPPYGHRIIESRRSCVFWGTTNSDDYLKDETGGRRFWPIKIGHVDIDGLAEAREQLWAEAQFLYSLGAPWWITVDEVHRAAEQHQRDRYIGDPWSDTIERYVDAEQEVSIDKVLRFGLGMEIARCGQLDKNRVARCLKALGLVRVQRRIGDKRAWVYRRPMTSPAERHRDGNVTSFRPVTSYEPVTRETPSNEAEAPLSPLSPLYQ